MLMRIVRSKEAKSKVSGTRMFVVCSFAGMTSAVKTARGYGQTSYNHSFNTWKGHMLIGKMY